MTTCLHSYSPTSTQSSFPEGEISCFRTLNTFLLQLPCSNSKWSMYFQPALQTTFYLNIRASGPGYFTLCGSILNLISFFCEAEYLILLGNGVFIRRSHAKGEYLSTCVCVHISQGTINVMSILLPYTSLCWYFNISLITNTQFNTQRLHFS